MSIDRYYTQLPVVWNGWRKLPCGCCCMLEPKHLTVMMLRSDIITAINEKANLIARATPNLTDDQRVLLKDIVEEGQAGIVADAINDAWAELVHAVSGYTEDMLTEDTTIESTFQNNTEYKVVLDAARNFSGQSVNAVGRACRSYLIHYALAYYLNLVGMAELAASMAATAEDSLADAKRYLAGAVRPYRVNYFPPW